MVMSVLLGLNPEFVLLLQPLLSTAIFCTGSHIAEERRNYKCVRASGEDWKYHITPILSNLVRGVFVNVHDKK